ncbi:hypothetical protein [Mesorhizobium sp. M5C.F.Cr.IN.023.01.1.1]|uniref:hypothetical protein n=1 Tax=Mesorhizobium sp. M5C.F.Cr.IN.023.01.1.1 TaxID=2496768 RepID=UPI001FE153F6|nr:hypothetical protein [Mesorhizobium sp. M5C.F.Cr.IN.023.01.1.1]
MVTEQTRLINRVKAVLARFGIRNFRLSLRQAADRLGSIPHGRGNAIAGQHRAEIHAFLEQLQLVPDHIPPSNRNACAGSLRLRLRRTARTQWVRLLARIIGIGVETADMLVHEILSRKLRDCRAVGRGWRASAMSACGAA